jgi:hypothetical protein
MTITGSSVLQRDPGATVVVAPYGPRGPVIAGTSISSIGIQLGPVTFVMTEYGLGFGPGVRLRATAIDAVDQWMEGLATAYADADLTIMVDLISGDGVYDSWQINVAGEPGAQGPIGPKGDTGQVPEAPSTGIKYARQDAQWVNITADFALKAPLASPAFSGTPTAPTVTPTTDSSTKLATTQFVQTVASGYQPADGDLTSLAAAAGTNTIYYRSGANLWSPVVMGGGVSFAGGTLSVTAGGGNVSNSGTPVNGQLARWINGNQIEGVAPSAAGVAPLASPVFTGNPQAPTVTPASDNSSSLATTAFVQAVLATIWSTGDAKLTFKTVADAGWIIANDGSIGNAASGATTRANADTSALFTLLYNNCSDTAAPIQTSAGNATTRAVQGTAATAFAGGARLVVPKQLGRSIVIAGAGSGLTARALGGSLGAETHTQIVAELAAHIHPFAEAPWSVISQYAIDYGSAIPIGSGSGNTLSNGSSAPMDVMNPSAFWNIMIKL